ncbi:MAG: FIG00454669: hypothetical protein [uncultured Paraburkholderia sp.]|nr:MAG: FIG00454669: hypothetical protein [uncultured Paraburkholderia sp.]CAH2915514.1 MAG: FIG00454669: hypothetical protein [uncultured Paraburkholderia sp.]
MNIDFHYGVVYIVARVAGMPASDAVTVAHACQYVDDATTAGILRFAGGETFERFATAHKMLDYANTENDQNRLVWTPFHFLSAGVGSTLEEKAVCRADSQVAREVVRRAICQRDTEAALHRLGVTLHTYVDTWAHQGFAGIESRLNRVLGLEAEDCMHEGWFARLTHATRHLIERIEENVLTVALPVGHGTALNYPDLPWAKWSYTDGRGVRVERNNLPEFMQAADMTCRAVRGFLAGREDFETQPGLPEDIGIALSHLLNTHRNPDDYLHVRRLRRALAEGAIPSLRECFPEYVPKGLGSWKHVATGFERHDDSGDRPQWTGEFEKSDYRLFHDAVKHHRFVTTQEILPARGLRIA